MTTVNGSEPTWGEVSRNIIHDLVQRRIRYRAAALFAAALLLIPEAVAFEKPTHFFTVRFAPGSTEIAPESRARLVKFLDDLRRWHWCPLEAIWATGHADPSESDDQDVQAKLAEDRGNVIANKLLALGAPASVTQAIPGTPTIGRQQWEGIVEVEAGSWRQPCPDAKEANGFFLPPK